MVLIGLLRTELGAQTCSGLYDIATYRIITCLWIIYFNLTDDLWFFVGKLVLQVL